MITSDTYRIAAVEQLRTYANILDIPLQVVYTIEELNTAIDNFKDYDLILVDTAGRSHKNKEQCMEMMHLVKDCNIPERFKKEAFLVLSATAKYKDLINIVETYSDIGQYNLIFTKLDETSALGNILNIKLKTNANLSYITSGQNVPDDIGVIDAQKLAKNLLGGGR
jgi:flagellar biosynthesis protein FlhF